MITGNKGEWSEFWAFVKCATDNLVPLSDASLNPLGEKYLDFQKIFREGLTLEVSDKNLVHFTTAGNCRETLPKSDLTPRMLEFLNQLQNRQKGSFECVAGEELLKIFHQSKLKAKSSSKKDLELEVADPKTRLPQIAGFSIKSKIGGDATLLNASIENTNFVFKLTGASVDPTDINGITSKNKIQARIQKILDAGTNFEFVKCNGATFSQNLRKIDSQMPAILGWATLINFVVDKPKKKLTDVLQHNKFENEMESLLIPLSHSELRYKFKSLLSNIALGMVPKTEWSGVIDADGRYLVVKKNGDVVCFHVYNLGNFQDYLLANVKFDTPSTNRHKFGEVYEQAGELFFKVNCQIRFSDV